MSKPRHSKEDALDRVLYLDLYTAALQIDDDYRRRVAIILVLCCGRLKMRVSEVMHLHEGWIDWERGVIDIPTFEPCGCGYCWKRSKRNFDPDDEENDAVETFVDYHYHNRFSLKSENSGRAVPFSWSLRITAALEDFFEHHDVIDENYKWVERTMKEYILPNARFLERGDVMFHGLRATGLIFWADLNLDSKAMRDVGGWLREADVHPYRAQSRTELVDKMRDAVGKEPVSFETTDFVSLDPRPLAGEPFDPRETNPRPRDDLYDPGLVINPRTPDPPAEVDYDPSRFASLAAERDPPTPSERRAFVRRVEALRTGDAGDIDDPFLQSLEDEDDDPAAGQARIDEYSEPGEDASAGPVPVMKAAYLTCLVYTAWALSFTPLP